MDAEIFWLTHIEYFIFLKQYIYTYLLTYMYH